MCPFFIQLPRGNLDFRAMQNQPGLQTVLKHMKFQSEIIIIKLNPRIGQNSPGLS